LNASVIALSVETVGVGSVKVTPISRLGRGLLAGKVSRGDGPSSVDWAVDDGSRRSLERPRRAQEATAVFCPLDDLRSPAWSAIWSTR
jgi:hypothetical protein